MSFDPRSAKNLVLDVVKRIVENIWIITSTFFPSFWIRSKSFHRRYFTIFIKLSIKLTNTIVFGILSIALLLDTRKARSSNPGF